MSFFIPAALKIWSAQEQGLRTVDALQAAVQVQDAVIDNIQACGVGCPEAARAKRLIAQQFRAVSAAPLLNKYDPSKGEAKGAVGTLKAYEQKVQGQLTEHLCKHEGSWRATMVLDQFGSDPMRGQGDGNGKKRARQCAAADLLTQLKLRRSN